MFVCFGAVSDVFVSVLLACSGCVWLVGGGVQVVVVGGRLGPGLSPVGRVLAPPWAGALAVVGFLLSLLASVLVVVCVEWSLLAGVVLGGVGVCVLGWVWLVSVVMFVVVVVVVELLVSPVCLARLPATLPVLAWSGSCCTGLSRSRVVSSALGSLAGSVDACPSMESVVCPPLGWSDDFPSFCFFALGLVVPLGLVTLLIGWSSASSLGVVSESGSTWSVECSASVGAVLALCGDDGAAELARLLARCPLDL